MTKLKPFRAMTPFRGTLWDEMNRLLPTFWGAEEETDRWLPHAEVIEKPDAFFVKVEVPGMTADEVDVNLTGDLLTVRGEKKQEEKHEDEHYHLFERQYGAFERTFRFPTLVDTEKVDAKIKDGVLRLRVMKREEGKTAKIKIKSDGK